MLAMLHVTALLLAHLLGSKELAIGPFMGTMTLLAFPVTFLTTDLLNEYFGWRAARRVTALSIACVVIAFTIIEIALRIPSVPSTHLPVASYQHVLGTPLMHVSVMLGSYAASQAMDVLVFHKMRLVSARGHKLSHRVVASTAAGEVVGATVITAALAAAPAGWLALQNSAAIRIAWLQVPARLGIAVVLLPLVWVSERLLRHE